MAHDMVPELYQQIAETFQAKINNDEAVKGFMNRLDDKKATQHDVSMYARRLGEIASESLTTYLTDKNLPDGKIYWNILERTVKPILQNVYDLINEAAAQLQTYEDKETGIGMKAVKADYPEDRIKSIMDKIMADQEQIDEHD